MKAKIESNGQIKLYPKIPNKYKNHVGFHLADESLLKAEGFFDVVEPKLKEDEMRGEIFFDKKNQVFTYTVIEKPIFEPMPPPENPLPSIEEITAILRELTDEVIEKGGERAERLSQLTKCLPEKEKEDNGFEIGKK